MNLTCIVLSPPRSAMEIEDCAYPLVEKVLATSNVEAAFTAVDYAVLVGGFPRKAGMQRADLMEKNAPIFVAQGRALEQWASRNVKVLVVANPANTNCLVAAMHAPSIPKQNFTALTRLDDNRAKGQLAKRLGVQVSAVGNTIIWGNHSKTQFPDIEHAHVFSPPPFMKNAKDVVNDAVWTNSVFMPTVQNRGAAVIEARGSSSAMSAANASADHLRSWHRGTAPGEWVSMGVYTSGQYGVEKGLIYSFPCTCANGEWTVVEGLEPQRDVQLSQQMLKVTETELIEEKKEVVGIIAGQQGTKQ